MNSDLSDPFGLQRFLDAQSDIYAAAISELRAGEKRSHWMWFIFPQVTGLGSSSMARRYAIGSHTEADAYLKHPILGPRLSECVEALLGVQGRSATQIMGSPDDLKLRSSMTLFAEISESDSLFEKALIRFFSGDKDQKTVDFLRRNEALGA